MPTKAGSYKVTATVADKNYELTGDTEAAFTVSRASAELSVSTVGDKNYKDADFKLDVIRKGDGVLTYASSDEKVVKISGDGNVSVIGVGTATISVSLEETANYLADDKEITVMVKKINHVLTVSNLTYNVTYGDAEFAVGATADDSESTITYESSDLNVATVDENGTVSIKNAGQTTIKVSMAESSNYNAVAKEVTVNVAAKPVTVTPGNVSRTYGEQDSQLTYTAEGLVGNDKLTDIILNRETGENVGTYKISAGQKDGANRNYKVTFNTGVYTITPKTVGITWGKNSFVYDGTEKVPTATATGLIGKDECKVTVTGAKTDAGIGYVATITKLSNSNYALPTDQSLLETTFTIERASAELIVEKLTYDVTYGDADFKLDVTRKGNGVLTYVSSDENVLSVSADGTVFVKGTGTATITVALAETANYLADTREVTVNVAAKPEPTAESETLQLSSVKQSKNTVTLNWNKINGADGYIVYGNRCNTGKKKYKMKKLATITNGNTKTWTHKKLKKGTSYKYCIKAYKLVNGKKKILKTSLTIHAVTTGGKYGTAKSVSILKIGGKKGIRSITLKKGKTAQITAREIAGKKPVKDCTNIRYVSGNTKVASVSASGKIRAKKKGTCRIWVYAQNGVYKTITVNVK